MVATGGQQYVVLAAPSFCKCDAPKAQLSVHRKLDRAVKVAEAHYALYLTFYGEYSHWLDIIIVNTSDGVMEWRNGKHLRSRDNGTGANQGEARAGFRHPDRP